MPNRHITHQYSVESTSLAAFEAAIRTINKGLDPFGFMSSQIKAQVALMLQPQEFLRALDDVSSDMIALHDHGLRRMLGMPSHEVLKQSPEDARFADPVWTDAAAWDVLKEWYLVFSNRLQKICLETPGLSGHARRRAAFWQRTWLNMMSPTNFFWLNPQAMARCIKTNGGSVQQGYQNFIRDAAAKNIQMVEPDAFTVGKDLATTPGKVIFRNRLVELIHYAPSTKQVRTMPILIITPWINKFYILDLTAQKSMVKHLTDQGFSVFISSWKNPTAAMHDVRFDDYLLDGIHALVSATTEFCRVPQVHLVGYCIGGTLAATYMAWANKRFDADKMPVAHWTLLTSLTDFSHPGEIEVFIDEASISALEDMMAQKGYLDGSEMASSFRLLRSNSLIWHYWVQSYLLGEKLQPFDVLFWNTDATRMPQAMHSYYLRQMYLHNNLVKRDRLRIAGELIDLNRITQPLYAVTAEEDHIAPWQQCYLIRRDINAATPVRFVRSTSGHILGIVNPPVNPPKRAYWVAEPEGNDDAERWLKLAEKKPGSWWPDWTAWLHARTGNMVPAYATTSRKYPALADAPGTYVLEK